MPKLLVAPIALAGAAAVAGLLFTHAGVAAIAPTTAAVTRGPIAQTVAATGSLEAVRHRAEALCHLSSGRKLG
jgi:hypothetical protein